MDQRRRGFLRLLAAAPLALMGNSCRNGRAEVEAGETLGTATGGADAPGAACEVTGGDILGPFHIKNAPSRNVLADPLEPGKRLKIKGRVLDVDCKPLAGAMLDVWHADDRGEYGTDTTTYKLRGQMVTAADGSYELETILPGAYRLGSSFRPRHVHFIASQPGFVPLTTQLYFAGDPQLPPNDPCSDCASDDASLVIALTEDSGIMHGTFDIVLARARRRG